ncbi:hypothetical protein ACRRTK_008306 [Alexandromys fortis]
MHGVGAGDEVEFRGHLKAWGRNYSSIIPHDCMWSSFSAREQQERVVSYRFTPGAPQGNPPEAPITPDCTPSLEANSNRAPATPSQLGEPKTQACSGSESPSDSEGEEIDVVTVEKRRSLDTRKPVTIMGAPERGPQEPEAPEVEAPKGKEEEEEEEIVSPPPVESETPQSCHPKPVSSDTEYVTKRKNHNFLERKRRNDLRSLFLALRDQVPTLASCSKAPKVVILSKALEYLEALVGAEKKMATEKRQLWCRQQ